MNRLTPADYDLPEACPGCGLETNYMFIPIGMAYVFDCFGCGHEEKILPRSVVALNLETADA